MLSFKNEREINTFLNKQKLRKFITSKAALQEMLKGILWKKKVNINTYKDSIKLTGKDNNVVTVRFCNMVMVMHN